MNVRQRIKKESREPETEVENNKKNFAKVSSLQLLILLLCTLVAIYIILFPILFYISSTLRQHVLFMNYINFSPKVNYSNPELVGLRCCKNFYLPSKDDSMLGIWYIMSRSLKDQVCKNNFQIGEIDFDDNRPVILYLHGSGGNRAARHRIAMYKVLTESIVDAHVVTLDYRGFGDSTNSYVNVDSVMSDAIVVYNWLLNRVKVNRIFIWGHSMGAALALKLASIHVHPKGLVMEAPFANSMAAVRDFPLTIFYRHMPFFQHFIVEPIQSKDTNFDNTALIGNVTFPVLILHARDDSQIPFYQGELLHQIAIQNYNTKVKFIDYDKSLDYGHLHIARDPDLPNKILSFMKFAASH